MFTIKVTYNGKPFNANDIMNDMKKVMIEDAKNHYTRVINSVLTPIEIAQVAINISERPDGNLSIKVEAPSQDIMDKIDKAMK